MGIYQTGQNRTMLFSCIMGSVVFDVSGGFSFTCDQDIAAAALTFFLLQASKLK